MPEDVKTTEEDVQFPLNELLLEESTKIKEERKVLKERLAKIEESKSEVSGKVYEKVKTDYLNQLNANTDQLLEKKQDIDRELAALYEAKKKVEENVNNHKHKLEEITFRHDLGEFKNDEFHKLADEENEKLGKFEKILAAIDSNIQQYESLFEDEEALGQEEPAMEEPPPPPPPPGIEEGNIGSEAEKAGETGEISLSESEEEYQVGGDEDYFGATDEVPITPGKVESKEAQEAFEETSPEHTPIEKVEKAEASAKISIEEGYGQGDVFEMTKDEMMIGRAASNDIVLKEAKVSRQHASIKKQGNEYLITDLHSSNGVFVNDEKVVEAALSDGDIIRIGDFVLKFTCK